MSGVEAAASLFGSEDSSSDPFTTLGTDHGSNPFDELFIGGNGATSGTSHSNIFDDSAFSTKDTYSAQAQQNREDVQDLENHSQRHVTGQNSSASWGQATEPHSTNSTAEPPASLSMTDYSNTYGSQDYIPRATNTKQLPVATSTYVNSYTPQPQPYAPATTYAPSTPYKLHAHSSYPAPPPANLPPPKYRPHPSTTTNMAYPPAASASVPQPPPPTSSTLTRPKLTNAYDPPFLPTKPSRRTGRSAAETYNVHQSPDPPAPYETALPNASAGADYQRNTPLPEAVGQGPPNISSIPSNSAGPPKAQLRTYNSGSNSALSQTTPYTSGPDMSVPHESCPERVASSIVQSNGPYSTEMTISSPETRSHTPRSASIGSNSSLTTVEKASSLSNAPSNTSPSMVPLSYSPPEPPVQAALAQASSQYTPHVSPQLSRRPLNNDAYAPTTRSSNYIPRTASPLQNQYLPSESGKVPAALNLNGVGVTPYNAAQRGMALPFTSPESDAGFHTSVDTLSPRHATGLREITRKFSSGQYAPSPSLVGTNDPLSRTSSRAPVVTFGFGGKLITCFRDMPGLNAGFDVALSARTSSELKVRMLQKVLPQSVLNLPEPSYPGPLVSDPGTVSLTLVRSAASSQAKVKKSGLTTYLLCRVEEIKQGLGFLSTFERQHAENKLILVKLLMALIENDGRFFGSSQAESAVRAALVPRLAVEPTLQDGLSLQATAYQTAHLDETPITVTSLRTASLTKIEEFLLQGNRRQAFQYAVDQKLWAHAMIIASSIDKDAWKEVVNDFLHQELTFGDESKGPHTTLSPSSKKTWESLRVAYSFFSGQGAAAVQEFAPPNLLSRSVGMLQTLAPSISSVTPRTPNFASMQPVFNILPEKLSNWAETVAMMISSPFTPSPEMNGALVALGDQLMTNNWIEAAHACYLLSPNVFSSQPPIISGFGTPGTRITLLGSGTPGNVFKDPDSLIFSEILEFGLSLLPTAKGQEQFHGLPHLQAYRFVRAIWLAEMGDVQLASRYCEAITVSLNPTSPYTNSALLEQLSGLQQRISGVFEKSNSWISGKLTKPSLDSIGGWLEGRFTKLVTGDNDSPLPGDDHSKTSIQQFVGPFAHYSTISSTAPSSRSSPQPTVPIPNQLPPLRTNSAMSNPYGLPTTEAESPRLPSSVPSKPHLQSSATSPQISSSQSSPTTLKSYSGYPRDGDPPRSPDSLDTPVAGSWWSGGANGATTKTPTAATFLSVQDDVVQASSDGFISLMDNQSFAFESKPPSRQATSSFATDSLDDGEDLGLGNSNPKLKAEKDGEGQTGNSAQENRSSGEKAAENTPAPGVAVSGSWLGRLFKRSDTTPTGPIKANLGEEKSLYYDKELKRWINTKGGAVSVSPAPTPPPARAQTASPGLSASKALPPSSGLAPPHVASAGVDGPPRPASAMDLTTEPPTNVPPPRIRSSLAPPMAETISASPISPSRTPPLVRPRSAAKRSVRNRYVDVFQQENGGPGGGQ